MSKRQRPFSFTITAIKGNNITVKLNFISDRIVRRTRTVANANKLAIGMTGYFSGRTGTTEFIQLI